MAYELKTKVNDGDVSAFLASVEHDQRREDAFQLLDIMTEVTGAEAKMWGKSIVGLGSFSYKTKSGHGGDWMAVGFSPRKQASTVYLMSDFTKHDDLLSSLGPYKHGKSCLYIKRLSDVNIDILKKLIKRSYDLTMSGQHGYGC